VGAFTSKMLTLSPTITLRSKTGSAGRQIWDTPCLKHLELLFHPDDVTEFILDHLKICDIPFVKTTFQNAFSHQTFKGIVATHPVESLAVSYSKVSAWHVPLSVTAVYKDSNYERTHWGTVPHHGPHEELVGISITDFLSVLSTDALNTGISLAYLTCLEWAIYPAHTTHAFEDWECLVARCEQLPLVNDLRIFLKLSQLDRVIESFLPSSGQKVSCPELKKVTFSNHEVWQPENVARGNPPKAPSVYCHDFVEFLDGRLEYFAAKLQVLRIEGLHVIEDEWYEQLREKAETVDVDV